MQQVYGRDNAFAALKEGGSVVAWGNPGLGGDTSKADGLVVAWGYGEWCPT